MTVTGRATEVNGLMPTVAVFDQYQDPVPALVLSHGDGTYTIQVADAWPGEDYFVRVSADSGSGKVVGNYDLDVEYGHQAATPTTFVASTLGGTVTREDDNLVVNQTQLFDFLLAVGASVSTPGPGVRMSITDAQSRVVATRTTDVGQTTGGDPVLLVPGVYRVSFTATSAGVGLLPAVSFRLYGASLTDPIGPALDDPTLNSVAGGRSADPAGRPTLSPIGLSDSPYTWLAITLAGPTGARTSLTDQQKGVGEDGPGPQVGPTLLATPAPTSLSSQNAVATAPFLTPVQGASFAEAAVGRPPQPVAPTRVALSALTVSLQTPFRSPSKPGHPDGGLGPTGARAEGDHRRQVPPSGPTETAARTGPGQPRPVPNGPNDRQSPADAGVGAQAAGRTDEDWTWTRLTSGVAIAGLLVAVLSETSSRRSAGVVTPTGSRRLGRKSLT